jgi:hypothetical protein
VGGSESQPRSSQSTKNINSALRAGFLRKVYGILATQMFVTVAVAAACALTPSIRSVFVALSSSQSRLLQFAIFIPTLSSLLCLKLGLQWKHPWNYILLMVFTFCQSINLGYICAIFQANELGWLVLQALAITAVIFVTLTAYTLRSGQDFSYMKGFLFTALSGLVIAGFLGLLFPGTVGGLPLAVIGALTFSGYILFDTWRIEKTFSYDEFIPAAIELYLDIINLFLYVLKILIKLQKKNKD